MAYRQNVIQKSKQDEGEQCFKAGEWEEAIESFTEALNSGIPYAFAYGRRAVAYLKVCHYIHLVIVTLFISHTVTRLSCRFERL